MMRVAYLHRAFPGALGPLVGFIAASGQHGSVFVAEKWARNVHIPGVRKARIPGPEPELAGAARAGRVSPEYRMGQLVGRAVKAGDVLLHLRKGGFVPDVLYGTADEGYLLYARDIFPKARLVVHLSWFYGRDMQEQPCGEANSEKSISHQTMLERINNCFPLSALNDCDIAIASSSWQLSMFSHTIGAEKIQIVKSGVDSRLFRPALICSAQEIVTFSCQGDNPARGIGMICASLPSLLARRPHCRVRLLSFAPTRSEGARQLHTETLAALLPPQLTPEQRQRVEIVVSPAQDEYVAILQSSAVYVYLTSSTMLSAGILEAMSCGVPVLASDTGPVRELVRHGENGFLSAAKNGASLAASVEQVLEHPLAQPASLIGKRARETVLEEHDLRKILPHHASLVLGRVPCNA